MPSEWDDFADIPRPRSLPILIWAIPVDILDLGARLEMLSEFQEKILLVRLAHRYRSGPLSTLPQEILDQIIIELLFSQGREQVKQLWHSDYMCFQYRCSPEDHFEPGSTYVNAMWWNIYGEDVSDPSRYSEE